MKNLPRGGVAATPISPPAALPPTSDGHSRLAVAAITVRAVVPLLVGARRRGSGCDCRMDAAQPCAMRRRERPTGRIILRGARGAFAVLRTLLLATALPATLAIAGCFARGEMKITTTWQSDAFAQRELSRTLVLCIVDDADVQRYFETRLAEALVRRGIEARAAGGLLPRDDREGTRKVDRKALEAAVRATGYPNILITLLASRHVDTDYVPPTWTPTAGGYYGWYSWGWGAVYHPGFEVDTTRLTIESRLYETESAEMDWMAVASVTDPRNIDDAVGRFTRMITDRLVREAGPGSAALRGGAEMLARTGVDQ